MMPIIDPEGMFNGDRFRKCSNTARLYWPYLFLASNGHARIEINYHRLVSRAFSSFDPIPTESEIMRCIKEYQESSLLFLYWSDGQLWGQWDCPARCLNKYKTASDNRSPSPDEKEFEKWRKSYQDIKKQSCAKIPETFQKLFGNIPEAAPQNLPLGVVVGDVEVKPNGDLIILEIAKAHPKLSQLKDETELKHPVATKIIQAIEKDGAEAVLSGTKAYAAQLDNPKFAAKPIEFFGEYQYRNFVSKQPVAKQWVEVCRG